jgi:hypothetical protein
MTNTIIIKLPSVDSEISSTGLVWSGKMLRDWPGPLSLEDCPSEWFESLDSDDAETVNDIITNNLN